MTKIIAIASIEGAETVGGKTVNVEPGAEANVTPEVAARLVALNAAQIVPGEPEAEVVAALVDTASKSDDEPPAAPVFIPSATDETPKSSGMDIL